MFDLLVYFSPSFVLVACLGALILSDYKQPERRCVFPNKGRNVPSH